VDSDALERAKIAMEEYKVLHAEILQRNNVLIQICSACIGVIVVLIGFMAAGSLPIIAGTALLVAVVVLMAVVWKIVDSDARNACKRIGEIEEYVNKAVGGNDTMPLSWTRRFGILRRSYVNRFAAGSS
jgi:high-affinity Fe2+/Pb2+ permease